MVNVGDVGEDEETIAAKSLLAGSRSEETGIGREQVKELRDALKRNFAQLKELRNGFKRKFDEFEEIFMSPYIEGVDLHHKRLIIKARVSDDQLKVANGKAVKLANQLEKLRSGSNLDHPPQVAKEHLEALLVSRPANEVSGCYVVFVICEFLHV